MVQAHRSGSHHSKMLQKKDVQINYQGIRQCVYRRLRLLPAAAAAGAGQSGAGSMVLAGCHHSKNRQ